MIIGIFDPSIIIFIKSYFYWEYLHEYTFTSNWNHVNPSNNKKVVLYLVTIVLGGNSQTTLACSFFSSRIGTPLHGILEPYLYWGYMSKYIFIWILNHSNWMSNKYFIEKTLPNSLRWPPLLSR